MKLRLATGVYQELEEAFDRYGAISYSSSALFIEKVELAFEKILQDPLRHPYYEAGSQPTNDRRLRIVGFPYLLVYRVYSDSVRVVAFAHTSREPGYWERR